MKFRSTIRRSLADERGYTLIELIAAMIMFALVSVVVIGALVNVMQSSTKTGAERRVQQDARYSIEEMARAVRSATIDYEFYTQNAADARCAFSSANGNSTQALALIFTEAGDANGPTSKRLVFFFDNNAVYRYQNSVATTTPTCNAIFSAPLDAASGPSRSRITSNDVTAPSLLFYISPNQDPYDKDTPCGPSCQLARNTHPRVTILMTVQTIGSGLGVSQQSRTGTTTLETTVGSRAYPINTLLGQPSS